MLAPLDGDELDFGSDEIDIRRQQVQTGEGSVNDRLVRRLAAEKRMIDSRVESFLLDTETGRCIPLRVEVGEEGRVSGESQACG